jgi:hypothetical protein
METLPCEIWDLILRQLAVHDIHSVAVTCKWFYKLVGKLYDDQFNIPSDVLSHKIELIKHINTIDARYYHYGHSKYKKQGAVFECFELISCIFFKEKDHDKLIGFHYKLHYKTPTNKNSHKQVPKNNVLHTYADKKHVNVSHIIIDYFGTTEVIYNNNINLVGFLCEKKYQTIISDNVTDIKIELYFLNI